MAMDFPNTPTNGQTYTVGSRTWIWNSTAGVWALQGATISTFGQTLLDDANAAAARATLELGTAATSASTAFATPASVTAAVDALKATVYGVVNHGATAGTARPSGFAGIIWYGSVQPTNVTGVDIVIRTDEAV